MASASVALLLLLLAPGLTRAAAPLGVMVPAYFYPEPDTLWHSLSNAATRVPLIVIMNPGDGPGAFQDPEYVQAVTQVRAGGAQVIGYVATGYATSNLITVKSQIDSYLAWYAVDGIFLDETTSDASEPHLAYYAEVYQFIKSRNPALAVVCNPGTQSAEENLTRPAADTLVLFEDDNGYPGYVPDPWVTNHVAQRFVHLAYAVGTAATMSNYVQLARARNAGWIYVTDDDATNPWDTLPAYWQEEAGLIESLNLTAPPLILRHPLSQTAAAGSNATFTVVRWGTAPVIYRWFHNGAAIGNASNATLQLTNVQPALAGNYTVVLSNGFGAVTSQTAKLTVETTFTRLTNSVVESTSNTGAGISAADYDNDGALDLLMVSVPSSGGVNLFRNVGQGAFVRVTTNTLVAEGVQTQSGAWADYDNDGDLDVILAKTGGFSSILFRNEGGGLFTRVDLGLGDGFCYNAAWGDFDSDGYIDVFISASFLGHNDFLYHNNRDGTFSLVQGQPLVADAASNTSAVWGDYDNDGDLDLFSPNNGFGAAAVSTLYRNNSGGQFSIVPDAAIAALGATAYSEAAAWGDYDNDRDLDLLVVGNFSSPAALFRNDGSNGFTRSTGGSWSTDLFGSINCSWVDYDNDGWLDMFLTGTPSRLYRNNRDSTFTRVTLGPLAAESLYAPNAVWADFNSDGSPDVALLGTPNRIYQSQGNSNAWLQLKLAGTRSNRAAIGAKVRLQATVDGTNLWQMREISGGSGWGNQNLLAYFGLGDATNIDVLRIEWPSGIVQTFSNVSPRQFLTIQEQTTFYFSVNGSGSVSYSPVRSNYFIGEQITLTATPNRYYRFVRWSDGNTNAVRSYSVGLTNFLTAFFTNTVPLEAVVLKQWEQNLGGSGEEIPYSVKQTSDGGYILGGYSSSAISGNKSSTNYGGYDYWVIKLDAYGNAQWEKTFGGSADDLLYSLQQTGDGGYILGGYSGSGISGNKSAPNYGGADFWVVRLDANGNKLWENSLGGTSGDRLTSVQQTGDGGYILAGSSSSGVSGNKTILGYGGDDVWVVKLDGGGNKTWERTFGGTSNEESPLIAQASDGGFIVAVSSASDASGSKSTAQFRAGPGPTFDCWVLKLDGNGNEVWQSEIGGTSSDYANSIQPMTDGNFVLASSAYSPPSGNKTSPLYGSLDYWVVRLDANGNKTWEQAFGGAARNGAARAYTTYDGGFVIGGDSNAGISGSKTAPNYGGYDLWVIEQGANGIETWQQSFGGAGDEFGSGLAQTSDHGYVLAGYSTSGVSGTKTTPNYGSYDFWVVKISDVAQPVGTPVVLVNGLYAISNSFFIPATNTASITLTSTFPGGYIYCSLDGAPPVPGEANTLEYSAPGNPGTPFVISNSVVVLAVAYSSDATGNVEVRTDPVTVHIVPLYNLTGTATGGGSVAVNPPGGVYLSNTVVTLTATPSNGWTFMRWEGAVTGSTNPLTLAMDGTKSIRAVFGTALTTTTNVAGASVALWPPAGPYPYGSPVRLVGVPPTGYRFNRWFNNISGPTTNILDFTVLTANTNIAAFFTALTGNNFTLTTLFNGPGTVTRSNAANSYASNATVTLVAVPDAGYAFGGWSGDTNASLNPIPLVMNTNKTVTANFTLPPTVVVTSPTNGEVFTLPTGIALAATATDGDGAIDRIEFLANGTLISAVTNEPFGMVWDTALPGEYAITARATDNLGATTVSTQIISIVVTALPPVIASFTPAGGPVGTTVSITGTNFNPVAANNIVFFGATRAAVTGATRNSLTAVVPPGATHAPISVTANRLTAHARRPFLPTFAGSGGLDASSFSAAESMEAVNPKHLIASDVDGDGKPDLVNPHAFPLRNVSTPGLLNSNSFAPSAAFAAMPGAYATASGDLDGDGRPEVVVPDYFGQGILVYQNISSNGAILLHEPPIVLPYGQAHNVAIADLDLDGRPEIIIPVYAATAGMVLVIPNRHSSGMLSSNSFLPAVSLEGAEGLYYVATGDLDGDGRPEIIAAGGTTPGVVSVYRNQSTIGAIALAPRVNFSAVSASAGIAVVDLDEDSKLDVAVANYGASAISVFRNTHTSGIFGPTSFAPRVDFETALAPWHLSVGDLDGDGRADVAVAAGNGVTSPVSIFRNTSTPGVFNASSFAPRLDIGSVPSMNTVVIADLDLDQRPDLAAGRSVPEAGISLFRNLSEFTNRPPTISLVSPTNGAVLVAPGTVSLSTAVTNGSGTVTQVQFFAGAMLLGSDTSDPFEFTWTNAPAGNYTVTAVAMDNGGLSATSAPVNVTVTGGGNQPPLVSLIAPTNGAVFGAGTHFTVTANALDGDGSVARVEFYAAASAGTNLVGIASNGVANQFSVMWSNVPAGSYSLTARAFDNAEASTLSAPVSVTVSLFEGPPAFRFEQAAYSVNEGGSTVTLRVLRNFSGFATVNFATGDGSAAAGADYNVAAGQLQFQNADSFKTIVVTILEDLVVEGPHTFDVSLSLPGGGALASPSVATVTILDNDVQTGSSFLSIVPPAPVIMGDLGSLRVYLTSDGGLGQWRLPWERTWRAGGTAATGLQPGEYEIEVRPISGYQAPPPTTLAVGRAQETIGTNAYTFLVSTPSGSLTVFLDPPVVAGNADANCRGQWQVNGGAFQDSGATVTGLPAGIHLVQFKPLAGQCGWGTPAPRNATVLPGASNSFRVSYFTNIAGPSTPAALSFANDIQTSYQNQQPFTFVGQLTTEFGEASGVVVKERVVLTAAHVVFDDYSLGWVGGGRWLFQRHSPDYHPAPQEVRGYYVNGGYAAQRQAEGTPGVSSAASFDLDVAALYFYEAAGRGGYGGYLVSETPSPQWLQTNALKALVGYPVEGVSGVNVGKMHAVGPTSMTFDQSTGTVFTCTQFRGLPGNSGGPLCVRLAVNNYFFPAGIYVGGSDRAIVRAIDSRAVDLINAAELTSNLGTNQTGGGVIRFGVTVPAGLCAHYATVTLQPPSAIAAGAQWRVHYKPSTDSSGSLSPWTNSSTYRIILNNKPDFLELRDAEGFLTPDTATLVLACQQTNLVFTYVQLLPRLDVLEGTHLVLSGVTNRQYRVEFNSRLGTTDGWTPWTNLSFPAGNSVAVLSNALVPVTSNRFYRAVKVP